MPLGVFPGDRAGFVHGKGGVPPGGGVCEIEGVEEHRGAAAKRCLPAGLEEAGEVQLMGPEHLFPAGGGEQHVAVFREHDDVAVLPAGAQHFQLAQETGFPLFGGFRVRRLDQTDFHRLFSLISLPAYKRASANRRIPQPLFFMRYCTIKRRL